MKELIMKVKTTKALSDVTFDAWEADLDNEALEAAHDEAYTAYHAAARELAAAITKLTGIDDTTAYRMAIHKLADLEALARRIA